MWFWQVSLLDGWLPSAVAVAAWGALLLGVAWWRRAIWHWVLVAIAAGALVALASWSLAVQARVGSAYPRSFLVWAALPLFALGVAVWQWPRVGWWRRLAALVSAPLLIAFGGMQINAHYGYLPTVGDLLGAPLPGQVSARALMGLANGSMMTSRFRAMAGNPRLDAVAPIDIPAPASHFAHRIGYVWVPPIYFSARRPHLPVLMLISGTPGTTGDWLRGGKALAVARAWAAAHGGVAPMLVVPDANGRAQGDTECVNGPRGQAETYLSVDVPRFMQQQFGAATDPQRWAIAGLSEGGTCALELAARHPDRFATFADFSGDPAPTIGSPTHTLDALYGGSRSAMLAYDPTVWFTKDALAGVAGFFAVGSSDHGYVRAEEQVALLASRSGMSVRLDVIRGGGHNFGTWSRSLRDAYPWIVARLSSPDSTPPVHVVRTQRATGHHHRLTNGQRP
jgi:S-formylglutathione hydrolase FrmB